MKKIGTFETRDYGTATAYVGHYGGPNGPVAVQISSDYEPLVTLSVNMYKPQCSEDSEDLPAGCFYVKTWSENERIAEDARKSGLFIERDDLPHAESGFVTAPVWQIKEAV